MSDELSVYAKKKKTAILYRNVFIGILVAALLGTAFYFVLTKYLVAKEVLIQGTDLYAKEDLLATCRIEENQPLITVSKKNIIRQIEEKFPYLVEVEVEFDLPHTVNVTFQEEFGKLAVQLGSELFSVDENLTVLAKEGTDSTIPRIRLYTEDVSRCFVGEKLTFFNESLGQTLQILITALREADMLEEVKSIDITDKFNIGMYYLNRFELLIGDENDLKKKFAMIREVVKDLGENETGRIDISDPNNAYVKLFEPNSEEI